ncbi:hypothetical protein S40285_10208 [Stachybotrys chlorohalonatus IBT 40285]|uniref:Uncharacterized protein n=1 Tax=Stachybotrys chlorohalonatus (strain IBT 40285) TaxID=1283841 RepID=A0A084QG74_STAC4|nr:hypothetical protein S40285_10208 [Stachybotrys chlorohalonata IBT 40285]
MSDIPSSSANKGQSTQASASVLQRHAVVNAVINHLRGQVKDLDGEVRDLKEQLAAAEKTISVNANLVQAAAADRQSKIDAACKNISAHFGKLRTALNVHAGTTVLSHVTMYMNIHGSDLRENQPGFLESLDNQREKTSDRLENLEKHIEKLIKGGDLEWNEDFEASKRQVDEWFAGFAKCARQCQNLTSECIDSLVKGYVNPDKENQQWGAISMPFDKFMSDLEQLMDSNMKIYEKE